MIVLDRCAIKTQVVCSRPTIDNQIPIRIMNEPTKDANEFEQQALEAQQGLVAEFIDFLRYNKKWWLTPIILVLLALGILAWLSASGAAPFIYPMF